MLKAYTAANPIDANFVRELLSDEGIDAAVRDERIFDNRGEVPLVYPSVWVREEDFEAARKVVDNFENSRKQPPSVETWECPRCGETIDASFTECWKCASQAESAADAPAEIPSRRVSPFILAAIILLVLIITYLMWRSSERRRGTRYGYVPDKICVRTLL